MKLLLKTHFKLAKDSLKQNRTRSLLTCLGIAIGIASIVLILSLTGSINRLIHNQVKSAGTDLILVRPSSGKSQLDSLVDEITNTNSYQKSNLKLQDTEQISQLKNVSAVAPLAVSLHATNSDSRTVSSTPIVGTTDQLADVLNLPLKSGSFRLSQENTAVIGRDLSLELFGSSEPVGKVFTLKDQKFLVTGLLSEQNDPVNFNNIDFDRAALISADTLKTLDGSLQIQQINVKVKTEDALDSVSQEIEQLLKASGEDNFVVISGDEISHPSSSLFNVISTMLTIVAAVSLVVGGIGVMNIMLVAVSERTHEIGIRKAVGASALHIFLQFLFESLILSFLGGLLGLLLGYILAFLLSVFTPLAPFFSLQILLATLYLSVIIGTFFGLYPAAKAALKSPIDSLKIYH